MHCVHEDMMHGMMAGMMGNMMDGMMGGMWIMMILGTLLVAVVIGMVIWLVIRALGTNRTSGDSAIATLRDRLARGEIDEREYRERRRILEGENT